MRQQPRKTSQPRRQGVMLAVVGGVAAIAAFLILGKRKPPTTSAVLVAVGEPTIT